MLDIVVQVADEPGIRVGTGEVVYVGGQGVGDTGGDYEQLDNKPRINNVELVGNKLSADLNLQDTMREFTNLEILALWNRQ